MTNLTEEQQKLILNRLAFKIISNEINSFEDLNQTLNKFDLELKSVDRTDTYFSELLENLEKRKLEFN
jgi:hypothetical protein